MRAIAVFLLLLNLSRIHAQESVTVSQLEDFVFSRQTAKESDAELAHRLGSIQLSEQLNDVRLARLVAKAQPGPQTEEQLGLLAWTSVFEAPPLSDLLSVAAPDAATQLQIVDAARAYATSVAHQSPNFIATRATQMFNSLPRSADQVHNKPQLELRFAGEHRHEVTYRSGHEAASATTTAAADIEGLTTWGEFGPILTTVLGDSSLGTTEWSRWEVGANGKLLAVFHYEVPKSASHDLIDLCCYLSFHETPAYHGDLSIDPATGTILQPTLDADLESGASVRVSKISVRYGSVEIGGKTYICPVRGVAVGVLYDQLEKRDGFGLERFVNVVHFTGYHKFGSTARILASQ